MAYLTETLNTKDSLFTSLYNFVFKVIDGYKLDKRIQDTFKELNMLSDETLRDIGIDRSDIYRIAVESNIKEKEETIKVNENLLGSV